VTRDRRPRRQDRIVYASLIATFRRGLKSRLRAIGSHGLTDIEFYVVSSTGRKRVPSWEVLERALILLFKRLYGAIPKVSTRCKGNIENWQKDLDRFNESTLRLYLEQYDE